MSKRGVEVLAAASTCSWFRWLAPPSRLRRGMQPTLQLFTQAPLRDPSADVELLHQCALSAKKLRDRAHHIPLRLIRNFRINRQGKCLTCCPLRFRKIAFPISEIGETFLHVQSDGIVNLCLDFALGEVFP